MMAVMSHVAIHQLFDDKNPNKISDDLVLVCEEQIDALSAKMEDNGYFILPGGSLVSAHLQLARTIVRRAERRLWTLNRKDPVSPGIMQFVNRLSDLFFTMARYEMFRPGECGGTLAVVFVIRRKNRIRLERFHKEAVHIFVNTERIRYICNANTRTICLLHSKKYICVTFTRKERLITRSLVISLM